MRLAIFLQAVFLQPLLLRAGGASLLPFGLMGHKAALLRIVLQYGMLNSTNLWKK